MNPSNKLLSDITAFRTYAKYLYHVGRRESLEETINRSMSMDLQMFPKLSGEIVKSYAMVHDLKVMPSMRKMQFAGDAIVKNNCRQFNCSYLPVDDTRAFGEILFLLLSGTGVGFSVQGRHIGELPKIQLPREEGKFLAQDSIIGWAQCVDMLANAYFYGQVRPLFDFSQIRPKGSRLVTTGAKAPGPEPLKAMLKQVEDMLRKALGRKLTDLEVHDIICVISECVLSGGIRRSACISLFDRDSQAMLTCKSGNWSELAPWRSRANNSVLLPRDSVSKEEFLHIYNMCRASKAGEPGISWTNDLELGTNPCHEISLRPQQFCNLTTLNATGIYSSKEFLRRVRAAAILGTIQAAYTDFPYLRSIWRTTTEQDALLGVSMTGIADMVDILEDSVLEEGARLVLDVNEQFSKKIGIQPAARATALKPEGTSSCILGSSSGIHDRHDRWYIRRIRGNRDDALFRYLKAVVPELVEDDLSSPQGMIVSIPQESPKNACIRSETKALDLFRRAIRFNKSWVLPGHRSGKNPHNVSATISVREEEWDALGEAMWKEREDYTGISLLPYSDSTYLQMPFESIDKQKFDELNSMVKSIDLRQVTELEDYTDRMAAPSCSGGLCEI